MPKSKTKTKPKSTKYDLVNLKGLTKRQRIKIVDAGWADRVETLADIQAVKEGCYFDAVAGNRIINFFELYLIHSKGARFAGKPFILLDWQKRDLSSLFGWMNAKGYRRFTYSYMEIPKKNGKSSIAAGVGLFLLVADGEPAAEIYTAATSKNQAKIVMSIAQNMAKASHRLRSKLNVIQSTARITYFMKNSIMAALTKDGSEQEGLDISGVILDELHVFPNRKLWDSLYYGGSARTQPLHFTITTAGIYDPNSIGWEQHRDAERLIDGKNLDISLFARIYGAGKEDDWEDEAVWYKANPSLDHTIEIDEMRKQFKKAKESTAKEAAFRRYRLNQWTNKASAYFNYDDLMLAKTNVTRKSMFGQKIYVGVDMASKKDLATIIYIWRDLKNNDLCIYPTIFIPEVRTFKDNNPNWMLYRDWVNEGWLTMIPGKIINQDIMFDSLLAFDLECGGLREVGYDPWNSTEFARKVGDNGIQTNLVRQGAYSMSEPMKDLDAQIINHTFRYNGNPAFDWAIENTLAEVDKNDNVRPCKITDELKIDPVVGAITGIACMIHAEEVEDTTAFKV